MQCRVGTEGMVSNIRSLIHRLSTKKACKIRHRDHRLSTKKACKIRHRDLANAQRLADEKVINAISNWFEDKQPFNEQTPK